MIGWQSSRHFLSQWETKPKPKPIASCTRAFSRAWRRLQVITSVSDWFTELSSSLVIGQSNCFGFGFTTLNWKSLKSQGSCRLWTTNKLWLQCENHKPQAWSNINFDEADSYWKKINNREREVTKIYHSSWILPNSWLRNDAKLNYASTKLVGKFVTATSGLKNGYGFQRPGVRFSNPPKLFETISGAIISHIS